MARLRLERVGKTQAPVSTSSHSIPSSLFQNLSFDIKEGEFVVLFGESGCGKSTLLRMVAGLDKEYQGRILFDEQPVDHIAAEQRQVAMILQSPTLFPHMTVADNITFPLRIKGITVSQREQQLHEIAAKVGVSALLARMPAQLSGGQQQRVALARCLIQHPRLFLFDEPLANLDRAARQELRLLIQFLHRELGTTTLFVTHDQEEAMQLADRIMVLGKSTESQTEFQTEPQTKLLQFDTPDAIFHSPENVQVARLFGHPAMNLIPAQVLHIQGDRIELNIAGQHISASFHPHDAVPIMDNNVTLGVRPDDCTLSVTATSESSLDVEIVQKDILGNECHCYCRLINESTPFPLVVRQKVHEASESPCVGSASKLVFPQKFLLLFNADGNLCGKVALTHS
ncbi:ABC transporter ATP-binding protein [Paraneptunicella aestuarii]|uniref:ABC transporter ATP-binding protein n=1 Tax=Paraneptunicella aestuarii TaxID=2831148 RepID=UPI001E2C74C3|nr:ABC transporter ATP-binding protein [Paraneptunicella aestuarii]UAA40278.1 ABC transporter ATP-binding protein [Paraneptunicella aestuarii]